MTDKHSDEPVKWGKDERGMKDLPAKQPDRQDLIAAVQMLKEGASSLTSHLANLVIGAVTTEELNSLKAEGAQLAQAIADAEAIIGGPIAPEQPDQGLPGPGPGLPDHPPPLGGKPELPIAKPPPDKPDKPDDGRPVFGDKPGPGRSGRHG